MLISPEYQALYQKLYRDESYGVNGWRWAGVFAAKLKALGAETVVDYGAGQGTLAQELREHGFEVTEYDPGVPDKQDPPLVKHDAVVSRDVLEHVEPDLLENVLEHIYGLSRLGGVHVISCRPAKRLLPDGSNAHRTVMTPDQWQAWLVPYFFLERFHDTGNEVGFQAWTR